MKNIVLIFLLFATFFSSKAQENDRFIAINITIAKSGDHYEITPTASTIVSSSKSFASTTNTYKEHDIVGLVQNEAKQVLDTVFIQQPLHIRYEYPGAQNRVGTVEKELSQYHVMIRFPFTSDMKQLTLFRVDNTHQLQPIGMVDLSEME